MAVMKPDADGYLKMPDQQCSLPNEIDRQNLVGNAGSKQLTWHLPIASLIFSTFTSLKPLTLSSVLRVAAWTDCRSL